MNAEGTKTWAEATTRMAPISKGGKSHRQAGRDRARRRRQVGAVVNEPITGGQTAIIGTFTADEAKNAHDRAPDRRAAGHARARRTPASSARRSARTRCARACSRRSSACCSSRSTSSPSTAASGVDLRGCAVRVRIDLPRHARAALAVRAVRALAAGHRGYRAHDRPRGRLVDPDQRAVPEEIGLGKTYRSAAAVGHAARDRHQRRRRPRHVRLGARALRRRHRPGQGLRAHADARHRVRPRS